MIETVCSARTGLILDKQGDTMRQRLLAGTSLLALLAWDPAARAVPFDFTYTGSLVTFTVPTSDTYQILAFGAQGGNAAGGRVGGLGAEIGGDFSLTAGEVLQIAGGGRGAAPPRAGPRRGRYLPLGRGDSDAVGAPRRGR